MSIAILNQVYQETRRLTIAGSGLAVGDFRLKKLVEPLQKAGKKAPVFGKVAEGIERLVDGNEMQSPQALLDLNSLVLAILYTQGQTGNKGNAKALPSAELGIGTTQISSRVLKPVLEALTTKGSGRMETVRDAFERGAFKDLRLVNPAIDALDDVYGELADFIATRVLPMYGAAILPQIHGRIDIKGKSGHPRRLKLLYALDKKLARPIVEEAFEKGSKEMKIAALGCLGDSKEDLPHLLDQAGARAKDVRRVALRRLAMFKGKEVLALFSKAMDKADVDLVVAPLRLTSNIDLLKLAQKKTRECFEELVVVEQKKKGDTLQARLNTLLNCFQKRKDKATVNLLLELLERRNEVGKQYFSAFVETLCNVMVSSAEKSMLTQLATLHSELDPSHEDAFTASLLAVLFTKTPKAAFEELSSYYQASQSRKKSTPQSETIRSLLAGGGWYAHRYHYWTQDAEQPEREVCPVEDAFNRLKWDRGWVDQAISYQDVEVVRHLATGKDKKALDFLVQFVEQPIKDSSLYETINCMESIVEIGDKRATKLLVDLIQRIAKQKSTRYGLGYWLFPLVAQLPKSSAKEVEKMLEGLPDNFIDQIMPHLLALKQTSK